LPTIRFMKRARRWLAPWKDSDRKPAIYHCINRIVDRQFVLGPAEKEKFRTLMRMYENFSGCRVLAYCLMSNHFHILLEVPPMPENGLSDDELLRRLRALYSKARVREVAEELAGCRERGDDFGRREAARIHRSFTYRMHDLSEFMRGMTQRFTRWFNRTHQRKGRLWEDRFRSVIVESGTAARTMAAYIDLNPVRAGIAAEPADYRWSSCGEAVGGGSRGYGKKAREGLVRAMRSADGTGFEAGIWTEVERDYRALMRMALERKPGRSGAGSSAETDGSDRSDGEGSDLPGMDAERPMARMLLRRIRYFTDGTVIGSRGFVDDVFRAARWRFGPKRKDGARKMRGAGAPAAGKLWSMRDLRKEMS